MHDMMCFCKFFCWCLWGGGSPSFCSFFVSSSVLSNFAEGSKQRSGSRRRLFLLRLSCVVSWNGDAASNAALCRMSSRKLFTLDQVWRNCRGVKRIQPFSIYKVYLIVNLKTWAFLKARAYSNLEDMFSFFFFFFPRRESPGDKPDPRLIRRVSSFRRETFKTHCHKNSRLTEKVTLKRFFFLSLYSSQQLDRARKHKDILYLDAILTSRNKCPLPMHQKKRMFFRDFGRIH